jgi:hypothetical protein
MDVKKRRFRHEAVEDYFGNSWTTRRIVATHENVLANRGEVSASAVAEQSQGRVVEMAPQSLTPSSDQLLRRIATLLSILVAGLLTVFGYFAARFASQFCWRDFSRSCLTPW